MSQLNFNENFYSHYYTRDGFITALEQLVGSENENISIVPFGSEINPKEYISNIQSGSRFVEIIKQYEGLRLYKLTHNIERGENKRIESGYFFIYEHQQYDNVYIAFTIEDSNFFNDELVPLLNSYYPDLIFTYLKNNIFKNLIEGFKKANSIKEIIVSRASQKVRKEFGRMPAVTWNKSSLEDAFNWVYENDGYFKSLQFNAFISNNISVNIFINRQGFLRTDYYFKKVFESFVEPICELINDQYKLFSKRSRKDRQDLSVKPLIIQYDSEMFEEVEENSVFIEAIRNIDSASVSVLHGNPYVHLSVLDYYDGSTFDIWILNSKQIAIVPQMKGSVAAIKRLINHIFDSYAEGEIKDYKE
ncbi:MAG: hypothetical protein KJ607_13850 [Bacteroidetes bacterium]|nr:hypothetical protein [Bacteroidota bacterium]